MPALCRMTREPPVPEAALAMLSEGVSEQAPAWQQEVVPV